MRKNRSFDRPTIKVKKIEGDWAINLTDRCEIALFGTEWVPAPFTPAASQDDIRDWYACNGQEVEFIGQGGASWES